MSFGSQSGRTRSGSKGFSNKEKKQKRKKQEFHTHKRAHALDAGPHDPEAARSRTLMSLERLGHQTLSTEPGGYGLKDWMRSLDSLLDDFQEKVGPEHVSKELLAMRGETFARLEHPPPSGEIDSEMEKLMKEEAETRAELDTLERKDAATLGYLMEQREARKKELKQEKDKLAALLESGESRPLFSRIRRSKPPTEEAKARVAKAESEVARLEGEIEHTKKARSDTTGGQSPYAEARARMEKIRDRLTELQSSRESLLQLKHEREEATKALAGLISSMKLDGNEGPGEAA